MSNASNVASSGGGETAGRPHKPHHTVHQVVYDDDLDEDDNLLAPECLVAGGVAGFVAETAMHPLETLSTRAKVHPTSQYGGLWGAARTILREEGIRGVMAGVSVTALISAPQTAVYFWVYETLKKMGVHYADDPRHRPLVYFAAGAGSELMSSMLFVPAEVIRNRMQLGTNPQRATGGLVTRTHNYTSLWSGARSILQTQGVRGLFVGWQSCLAQDCAFSALQFMVYEQFKAWRLSSYPSQHTSSGECGLTTRDTLLAGAVAGSVAALATNPLDVVTTRLMAQDSSRGYGSTMRTVITTARAEGILGLWRGSVPRVFAVAPLAAIQFAVYERVKEMWLRSVG